MLPKRIGSVNSRSPRLIEPSVRERERSIIFLGGASAAVSWYPWMTQDGLTGCLLSSNYLLTPPRFRPILNHMVKYQTGTLDTIFTALSDRTRRGILTELLNGGRSVTELSTSYDMSLPGFVKHLQILEDAGLISREKSGRVVKCNLTASALQPAGEWLATYREFWAPRLDALEKYLKQQETPWPPQPPSVPRSKSSANIKRRRPKSGRPGPRPKR